MYRSLPSSADSLFSLLDGADDSEILEDASFDCPENEDIFPDLTDTGGGKRVKNINSIVADAGCDFGLYSEPDHVNSIGAGQNVDNDARVKVTAIDYQYLYADGKQELDFFDFQAHIHKTSSARDLAKNFEEESVFSMAPVITVAPPVSPPSWQALNLNNLQPDMLGKKSRARGALHSSGYSTPSDSVTPKGSMTPSGVRTPTGTLTQSGARTPSSGMRSPTGIMTPSGLRTPTPTGTRTPSGSMTPIGPSPPSMMKKSSSTANLIHFHNLENVSIADLYPHNNSDHNPTDNSPINLNLFHDKEAGRSFGRSFQRYDGSHVDKKYKSHSCPHSRHHSPPRQQRHRIETVNETDSLQVNVTASAGTNGNVDLKDINFNDMDDIKIINEVDDNLMAEQQDEDQHECHMDGSYSRQRSESLSFADLFHRCRYERDTSVPNTPYEGDNHAVDTEQLMNQVNDFLCAERVSQMTKTYHDIEAVTRLLEEKERDLELAARIGQTLLSKNKEFRIRSETLEEQLAVATERVNQLHYEVVAKDELLKVYNEEQETSGDTTPNERSGSHVNVDYLEKKVKTLEDENLSLRLESEELKSETEGYEEKEKRLVEDCILQIADVSVQVEALAEELHLKVEENAHQKEEITGLLAQIADLQTKIRKLTLENMDMHEKLTASMETQRKMTKDLGSMQDKYDELLEEFQEELRNMKGKHKVHSSGQHHHSAYSVPTDSLASELETSLQQELSQSRRRSHSWKVFETARAAKRAAAKATVREKSSATRISLGAPILLESDSLAPSAYPSDVESMASDGYSADMDSLYGSNPELGQPGIPGSNDLESALKRLAMRRANEQNERDFHEEEEERRRKKIQAAMSGGTSPWNLRSPPPYALRSPTGSVSSSNWSTTGMSNHYKFSEKLQIVKPMEGSMTLRHWQHLATPHLGGIFEERDGVQIKGEKKLDLVEEIYSLSDFEEDDDTNYVNKHKEQDLDSIHTYTDSTISDTSSYRGQGKLFTSSSPVNAHMYNGGRDDKRSGINSEAQSNHSGDSSQNMSRGLGSLLQGRENTEVGRALMRVAALKRATTQNETLTTQIPGTTLDINQQALASRGFASHPYLSSLTRNIPGSRSFDQAMKEYEEKRKPTTESAKKPELFAPGMTGKGFLQQLKSKGYSLYGLWGGGAKDSADSSTDGAGEGSKSNVKTASESVFSNGAGVGVLGALTNFRRNGMF